MPVYIYFLFNLSFNCDCQLLLVCRTVAWVSANYPGICVGTSGSRLNIIMNREQFFLEEMKLKFLLPNTGNYKRIMMELTTKRENRLYGKGFSPPMLGSYETGVNQPTNSSKWPIDLQYIDIIIWSVKLRDSTNQDWNACACICEVLGCINILGHWCCNEWWLMMIMMAKWYSGTLGA